MPRFNFNLISLSDSADITKVAENFTELETNGVSQTDLTSAINSLKDYVDNAILNDNKAKYPVGKILMSTDNTNPSTYLGFGTWVAWGSGKVPVGIDTNDSNFNTTEKTGGSKTNTLTTANLPSHNHTYAKANGNTGNTTLTLAQIPAHSHKYTSDSASIWAQTTGYGNVNTASSTGANRINVGGTQTQSAGSGGAHNHTISTTSTNTGNTGSGTAVNNLQPYITCYMWKRTA